MKRVAIVQARYASTRLPGKILKYLPYGGSETVIEQVVKRLKRSDNLDEVIVATTDHKEDDAVVKLCTDKDFRFFRGSMDDVLGRYYSAASESGADIVVRVTSDCPCIDVSVIDDMLLKFDAEYMSNVHPRVLPHGMDAEVFTFDALKEANENAAEKYDREHVTPYIMRNAKRLGYLPPVIGGADIRITLDRQEDYTMLCAVYDYLYDDNEFFGLDDILSLFERKPWLKMINECVKQKKQYGTVKEEICDAVDILKMQELSRAAEILEKSK